MTTVRIKGRFGLIDGIGFDDDPEYAGRIAIAEPRTIHVPKGMLDEIATFFTEDVVVTCKRLHDGSLVLVDMDIDNDHEDAEDNSQAALFGGA